jgi:membrane protein
VLRGNRAGQCLTYGTIHRKSGRLNLRLKKVLKSVYELIRDTLKAFFADRATIFAAGLAYFTLFALAPLLVIVLTIAGFFIGRSAAGELIMVQFQAIFGAELSGYIMQLVESLSDRSLSTTATLFSIGALLVAASGIFNQLKIALNTVWGVSFRQPDNFREWITLGKRRIMPLVLVFAFGALLAVSVILDTLLGMIQSRLEIFFPGIAEMLPTISRVLVPSLTFVTFLLVYKVLPDATTRWRDIGVGSVVAALLFLLGRYLMSIFISSSDTGSIYGAASSLIVLLVWVYFSASIVLLGAEFIKFYADRFGEPIRPRGMATLGGEKLTSEITPHAETTGDD